MEASQQAPAPDENTVDQAPAFDDAEELFIANFWEDLRDSLPEWLDEIIAIALLLFGLLSFLALFNTSQAIVAVAWSDILKSLFGNGSILIAGGLFAMGVLILLPRIGVTFRFSPQKVLALEVAFLCVLAMLHLLPGETELRALARAGGGGGMLGWGLTLIPYVLLGRTLSLMLFGVIFFMGIATIAGFRRVRLINWLFRTGQELIAYSEDLLGIEKTTPEVNDDPFAPENLLAGRHTIIMHIRPDITRLPPSLRPGAAMPEEEEIDISEHPLFKGSQAELKTEYNQIGEITENKDRKGHAFVIRPDGRRKRYFEVKAMKEEKKVGRRDKVLPELEILNDVEMQLADEDDINRNVVLIENTLLEFDVDIDVVDVQVGPTVTRYAVQPFQDDGEKGSGRTRLSKIAAYTNDLALSLSAKRLRMELPVPGTNYMGIEVPNKVPGIVTLRSVFESKDYYDQSDKNSIPLAVPLGRDVSGRPVAINLAKMPHLLIAGTTGSGKSVCMAALAVAVIMNNRPDKVQMVMLDPKMVELSRFNGIPHLIGPVETDIERIIGVLKWCTREMDRRYKLLEEHAVRNIDNYNEKFGTRRRGRDYMPYIVIMVDEIGDLMTARPEETENAITRLAQMARAVGMHLIIATQRPSVDVITGLIKANFPGRIAFSVASGIDSRVILDSIGAESLMGMGDMLFQAPDAGAPRRVQGCFVSDDEVRKVVEHWQGWYQEKIEEDKMEHYRQGPWERGLTRREFLAETDPMLEEAIEFVVETQEASASLIQRRLGLGYPRAARLVDMLEELGVIGDPVGGGRARKVLIPKGEDPFKRIIEKRMSKKKETQETSEE